MNGIWVALLLALTVISAAGQNSAADLILTNANVRTMDKANPRAEAVAVADGRITAVGTTKAIQALAGKATKIIDVQGKLVLPGFNDAHVHFMSIGNLFSSIDLSDAKTEAEVMTRIAGFAHYLPKGRWILGGKLDPSVAIGRSAIDAVSPDNPVFIYRSDIRSAITNTAALKASNLDEKTFASGELPAAALSAVQRAIPTNHVRDWTAIAETAGNYAASFGLTSVQDTHSDDMAGVYKELNRQGKLKVRVYDCVALSNWARLAAVGVKAASGDAMVRTGCLKGSFDEEEDTTSMTSDIAGADKAGLQVLIHAIGPAANSSTLAAFENAIKVNGARDSRFRVEHAHNFKPADLSRFARSAIIASMQPYLFYADGTGVSDDLRKLWDGGAKIAFGSDAAIKEIDPLLGIYAAVNAGGKRAVTVDEAVYAYTLGAAYAEFQEKEKGNIEVGKLADLVILSDDIFEVPALKFKDVRVLRTILNGVTVYAEPAKVEN